MDCGAASVRLFRVFRRTGRHDIRQFTADISLAGAFEALLGAIYHDGGYQPARRAIERYFSVDVTAGTLGQQDYKTRLQEISQMLYRVPPVYRIVSEAGPDHEKFFTTEISIDGKVLGKGAGPSKKKSEQEAAKKALQKLQKTAPQAPRD